ncbi:conserved Plasmodium protein, unknown function [Plasmodium ovale]|uniref:EF-hand domain-containing protein n=1 Tax=Plasmodium ovale TaxID=36330 RepID=A0A1D3TL15_PLAOA|nr:conserved Plasmodium protein, unknown function [Plasmodium ovale]
MLKFHLLILLCIFLKYPSFILKENIFENITYRKNEYITKTVARYYKPCGRLLVDDDFFNIEKLKKLLYFQSKLDKNVRKKKKAEKKLKKLHKAAKNGNFIHNIHDDQKGQIVEEKKDSSFGKKDEIIETNNRDGYQGKHGEKHSQKKKEDNMNNTDEVNREKEIPENENISGKENLLAHDKNEKDTVKFPSIEEAYETTLNQEKYNDGVNKFIKRHAHSNNSLNVGGQEEENEKSDNIINLDNILKGVDFYKKVELVKNHFKNNDKAQNVVQSGEFYEHIIDEKNNNENAEGLKIKQGKIPNGSSHTPNFDQVPNGDIHNMEDRGENKLFSSKDSQGVNKKSNANEYIYGKTEKDTSEYKNFHLRKNKIKEFLDVNDLVKYMKNFLGIKSNIHEKFEHEKLIVKNCNYESFGPDFCSVDEEAKETLWKYEKKKNSAFLFIILFTLFFSLLIQNLVYYIEKRVRNSKDQFRKDLLNTAFRQISLITIINLTIWGILQSNVAEALDEIIFNDILPKQRNVDEVLHNVEPLLETIFEKILFISMNFLICYSLFIINIHFVTRRILKWFSEADNCDISNIAKEMKECRKGCFKNLFFSLRYARNSKYLAHRYDFSENVDAISIPGLDPNGYYYYEYMRACLLKYNVKLIKIPNAVILFLVFACISLRPFFNIRLKAEVIFLNALSLICTVGLTLLFIYLHRIDRKLLPRDISKYLLNRYHIDACEQNKRDITPYYKLLKQQSVYPSALNYFIYKSTFPNKHEQLFLFWGNGPSLVNFVFQTLCFCFLIILSCWIFLLRVDNITWFQLYSYGSLAICVCILFFLFILKYIIYYNIMVSKTGYLIDTKLLEKVWEFERSDNIKRISELIDAIKIKSTLHALKEGGDMFWRQLLIKSNTVPSNIQEKMFSIWVGLDEENRGVIDSAKILKFLKSQGINLTSENDIKEFLDVFDRNNKKGLNQEEFFVLIIIVKQILVELLDINAVQSLFEEVYGIPWNSLSSIDVNSLKRILSELNLQWPHGKIRNLIDFVCENKKTKYVSAEYFIKQLINIEEVTLQPFHSVSDTK